MRLKVTLLQSQSQQAPDNVQITADATATVGDVATALAGADRRSGQYQTNRPLTLARAGDTGRALSPDQTLLDSGIRSGATLALTYADTAAQQAAAGAAVATLRVLEGPDAGAEYALATGGTTIGRSRAADIKLQDASVSKQHARIVVGSRIEVVDLGSSNGVVVGGVRVNRVVVAVGDLIELGDTVVSIVAAAATSNVTTDVAFIRSPRVLVRPERTKIELPDAPRPRPAQGFPWLMLMVPMVMGGLMYWRMQQSGSGSSSFSLIFIAMTPLLMLANFFEQRRQRSIAFKGEVAEFEESLEIAREQLTSGHDEERRQLLALHPAMTECLEAADRHAPLLWCRRPEHPEFLTVRFGLGDVAPHHYPELPRAAGMREFHARAQAVATEFEMLSAAPVVSNLRVVGGLGVAGPAAYRDAAARAVVAQVTTLHSPAEVVLACLTSATARRTWDWMEWLPHVASPHSPLPFHLAADPGTGAVLLSHLEELIATRNEDGGDRARGPLAERAEASAQDADVPTVPSVVVVVHDTSVDRARLTRIAESGPAAGVYVVWVADSAALLPACCRTFATIDESGATVGMVREEISVSPVGMDLLDAQQALGLSRRLAPLVDAGRPVDDASDLPQNVSMVSLIGHEASDDADVVVARWQENQSLVRRDGSPPVARDQAADLRAVVGHAGTEPFTLDLRSQGPHALIGGTTGAGKSEFLQAWVLGLAHAYSPDRVTFLFVDYKGGAAFASCVELPHCVGMVTDLSPYLVRRALRSLRAELHYRERLLNAKGKKDLIELEKTGDPECPPSLVIVVDEFAALVSEVPEFVDGVVDVAQRGRSLGLHLVLATQRPAGVIKDNLRANTNLRIALRMADASDSEDVLGDPMAAFFPSALPGRGAAKTGAGRITSFQSAFPGARTSAIAGPPPIEVDDLDFGNGRAWKMPAPPTPAAQVAKDIDRMVTTIQAACARGSVPEPRRPWLDALAPIYSLARLNPRRDTRIPLGVIDVPDRQAQLIEFFRPDEDGNLLIFGAGGSGKSTTLRTLAAASAITPGGGVVHIYGLDFASGALGPIEALPNVGSIISGDDEERVRRLIDHLSAVVEERTTRYAALAPSNLDDYRRLAEAPSEPRVLLLLDGFTNFRTEWEASAPATYQRFQRILLDGRAVGVHVAMTADRPAAVPGSIMSAFQRRIVLRLSDDDAYLSLGVPRDVLTPSSAPGRAIWEETGQEMQIAVMISDEHARAKLASSAAQAAALEALGRTLSQHHERPPAIRSLPAEVSPRDLPATVGDKPTLGIGDLTLAPIGFDPAGVMLLAGPVQSGRSNAVLWTAEAVARRWPGIPLIHLSARRSPLGQARRWAMSADTEDGVRQVLEALAAEALGPSSVGADGRPPLAMFVEYVPDFIGTSVETPLLTQIQALKRLGCPILGEGETPSWTTTWPLTMEFRNARTGLLLQPDQADGDNLMRTAIPRTRRIDFPPGRGYWVKGGVATKVQVPLVVG